METMTCAGSIGSKLSHLVDAETNDSADAFALSVQRVLSTPPPPVKFLPLALRGKKPSLEVLAPEHNSPLREAELSACVAAMLSTTVGGGALSIPYAFLLCGVKGGLVLLFLSGLASDFALYALCSASRRTGTATLAELARAAQGHRLENMVVAALFMLCAFVAVAYTRLLRDLLGLFLAPFIKEDDDDDLVDRALFICAALVLFPLSLYRELHRLRYAAMISFTGALCVAALFAVRAAPDLSAFLKEQTTQTTTTTTSFTSVALVALPIFAMSYLCQFNVLSVHARLKHPTRNRLKVLLHTAMGLAFFFYVIFGISGMIVCADAPPDVAQDALACLAYADRPGSTDVVLACAGGAFAVALLLNTPALIIPLRDSLLVLTAKACDACFCGEEKQKRPFPTERTPLADVDETKADVEDPQPPSRGTSLYASAVHFVLTAGIVIVVILGAQRVPGVASVWAVAGSSVGLFISFMLPCYLYLKVRGHKDDGPARIRKTICAFLFLASLVLAIVCTYRNAKAIIFP